MIEFPQDLTVTQRTAQLMEWLIAEQVELPVVEIAERLGIGLNGVYKMVSRVSVTSPNVVIEDGRVFYRHLKRPD